MAQTTGGGGGGWHEIHYAAFEGKLDKVKELLRSGVYIDEVGPDGKSALHQAAGKGHMHVVNFLLEQGANSRLKDGKGRTPGEYSRQCGQYQIDARLAEVDGRPPSQMPHPEAIPGELKESDRRRIQQWLDSCPIPADLASDVANAPVPTPR
eukprot:TRINITY_DN5600_c0_g1_i1.p1 TRINITY_DN5600_c0_g1~~TRINITY_DN5600_c0_g1_i1.p1  ORF type:complete len:152 (+),score=43.12 TRINITY_DN5600_c0_g1_i1:103-558(+)